MIINYSKTKFKKPSLVFQTTISQNKAYEYWVLVRFMVIPIYTKSKKDSGVPK